MICDGYGNQLFVEAKFMEVSCYTIAREKIEVLILGGIGHTAVPMAGLKVALVETEVFKIELCWMRIVTDASIFFPISALAAIGLELFHRQA